MKIWFIITIILVLVATAMAYTTFNPNAEKPMIEKPELSARVTTESELQGSEGETEVETVEEVVIEEEHVQYAVNELGAYNLHDDPTSGEAAVMQIHLTDTEDYFVITIENNYPEVEEGTSNDKDLTLHMSTETFAELIQADDLMEKTKELANRNLLWAEPHVSEKELALKGYLSLYKNFT